MAAECILTGSQESNVKILDMLARPSMILLLLSALVSAHDVPMSFEPCLEVNCGAAEGNAQFLARGPGYNLFLTPTQAVLDLRTPRIARIPEGMRLPALFREAPELPPLGHAAVRVKLLGARPGAHAVGVDELPGKTNYFIGNDPKRWRTNVPTYARVAYRDVYPGITLIYYGSQGELEFDLVCSPGADPKTIRLAFEGAEKIEIDSQGALALETPAGRIHMRKPLAYQPREGARQVISAGYVRRGAREVGFEVDAYDRSAPLVVDPVLVYATYIGTRAGDNEYGTGIAVDSSGSVYVTGITMSADFPITPGAFQKSLGSVHAFVTKLNAEGTGLVYSTYLGGSDYEESTGIKVDSAGNAYVTGRTYSKDFPTTPGVVQPVYGGGRSDVFVAKLNATGSALVYSTFLGGGDLDRPYGIAIDPSGNAYVAGATRSSDFPVTPKAFQRVLRGDWDAFVAKLDGTGTSLVYSTYLGGSDSDGAPGIAVDASGNAYVAGSARSVDFPTTPGAFQGPRTPYGGAFVTKVNAAGDALIYSTILGEGGLAVSRWTG
jgi:hypothetical protein